jgi:hypothetical protein
MVALPAGLLTRVFLVPEYGAKEDNPAIRV